MFARKFVVYWHFFKIDVFKESFRNTIRASNGLYQEQGWPPVGPDLSPNCLQRLSSDGKEIVEWMDWKCYQPRCTKFLSTRRFFLFFFSFFFKIDMTFVSGYSLGSGLYKFCIFFFRCIGFELLFASNNIHPWKNKYLCFSLPGWNLKHCHFI